jgi:hypothetical protein
MNSNRTADLRQNTLGTAMGQQNKGRTKGRSDYCKFHVMGLTAQTECKKGVPTAENAVLEGTFLANMCLEHIFVAIIVIIIIIIIVIIITLGVEIRPHNG